MGSIGSPVAPIRLARARRNSRYGAPRIAVTIPTGSSVGAKIRRATRSDATRRSAPHARRRQQRRASGRRRAGGRSGATTRATNRSGRPTAVARAASAVAARSRAPPRPLDPGAEALGRVVAQLEQPQLAGQDDRDGHQHRAAPAETGRTCSQPRPFRLPVSHTVARWASKISARVSRYEMTEPSTAVTPMPTSTSR